MFHFIQSQMKNILIIIVVITNCQLSIVNSYAQSISRNTIATAGGTLTAGGQMISFNIGGSFIPTLSAGGKIITQGFEQPGEELHTGTVTNNVCAGSSINIPFTAIDMGGGNSFTAQLSDANGTFSDPVNIGTQTGNASGSIDATIPLNIAAGTHYRIRVLGSYPQLTGTDNGTDIVIAAVNINSIINNACHAGNEGSINAACASCSLPGYSFSIAGPTVNTTGTTSGIFTGLSAGNYTITLLSPAGCSSSRTATVTEPPGTLPDISLGADYSSSFFLAMGAENTIVYNVSEIAGNAATGDTIRIVKPTGYSFTFDATATNIDIGSTSYILDNNRWKLDNSSPLFASLILDPSHNSTPGTLNCGGRVFVSLKLKRNTLNVSTFSLSARLRKTNNETFIANNLSSILFTAE